MRVVDLLTGATETGAGTGVLVRKNLESPTIFPVIVTGITTGTIILEVSLDGVNYEDHTTFTDVTADGASFTTCYHPYIRANCSVATDVAVTVKLGLPK